MFIGVTGGVGAGKSTILQILEDKYNAHIIMADDVARELMNKGKASYRAIVKEFGDDILREDGEIDRQKLAEIVFQDEEKLNKLNSIVHPLVRKAIVKEQKQVNKKDPERLVVLEAALLIEAGYKEILDELWGVIVQKEIRIQRLMDSRGYTREKSESIIANQLSDEEFREHCDFIIDNSGTLEDTAEQIRKHFERDQDR
ncbi:MAG: dephospho-CoA kinase [Lachnospiraceae bacterium]|nr:dephospho-CoA kinase [Lachnospiraceae bacterium]